jgi:hypothetical protein
MELESGPNIDNLHVSQSWISWVKGFTPWPTNRPQTENMTELRPSHMISQSKSIKGTILDSVR